MQKFRNAVQRLGVGALVCLVALAAAAAHHEKSEKMEGSADASGSKGVEAIQAFISSEKINTDANNWKLRLPKPPQVDFDPKQKIYWNLTTSQGDIKIRLMPDVAPMHVSSTIYLTTLGFYDSTVFHRVIPGFMAQGGDPLGRGMGGPGYKYDGEYDPKVKHDKGGLLSMANAGPGTDGSQFFLTFVPTPHLDGKHTIFGEVTKGKGTLKKLEARGSRQGRPSEALFLVKATITVE
jgi:cyclophilin family peptidyl-prolyl cis-trans isomerase